MNTPGYRARRPPGGAAIFAACKKRARASSLALIAGVLMVLGAGNAAADPCSACKDKFHRQNQTKEQTTWQSVCWATGTAVLTVIFPPSNVPRLAAGCIAFVVGGVTGGGSTYGSAAIAADAACARVCAPQAARKPAPRRTPPRQVHLPRTSAAQTSPDILYQDPPTQVRQHDPSISAVGAAVINQGITRILNRGRGAPPGISQGGSGCPPGMRRSKDNPNCHYPGQPGR